MARWFHHVHQGQQVSRHLTMADNHRYTMAQRAVEGDRVFLGILELAVVAAKTSGRIFVSRVIRERAPRKLGIQELGASHEIADKFDALTHEFLGFFPGIRMFLREVWKILLVLLPRLLGKGKRLLVGVKIPMQKFGNAGLDIGKATDDRIVGHRFVD